MGKNRKIKIVEVIADSGIGGGPKHILGLLKHLDREQFELFLICPFGWLAKEAGEIRGVKVFGLEFRSKFDMVSLFRFHQIINQIRAASDPFGPVIIHAHGPRAGLVARLRRIPGVRYIYTEHIHGQGFRLKNRLNDWFQRLILARLNRKTDRIIAVSSASGRYLVKSWLAPADRLVVIPNGIDLDKKIKTNPRQDRAPIIGNIGNLYKEKGQRYLIEAFAKLAEHYPLATLEIVGEGPERRNLEIIIKSLGLEHRVTLIGQVKEIESYLRHWRVFVSSSLVETFGLAILEAMAAGLPVVATRVGAAADMIEDGQSGLLVKPGDAVELVKKIRCLLTDERSAQRIAQAGSERAKEFEWSKVIKRIEAEYIEISRANKELCG